MTYAYRTIEGASTGQYKEKGSRFLSFAFPVETEESIRTHLEALQKEYFDARHHCYAWILGTTQQRFRANDAGEPNHSAGDPILGQIRSRNLTNVLVVVVRYFGGIKLGVGGLITAYRAAAEDALNKAAIVEREITGSVVINYTYEATPEVMRLVRDFKLTITQQEFQDKCSLTALYSVRIKNDLSGKLELMQATGTPLEFHFNTLTL
jgi:uncharacterized YigZ family protein